MRRFAVLVLLFILPMTAAAQDSPTWSLRHRVELRANYRNTEDERFRLRFPFPPDFIPPGQDGVFLQTVDPGAHFELSVAQLQLDLGYGRWFGARARVHFADKYRRNPTSSDRKIDADELFVRFGEKPEFLDRPERTSFFVQAGKAPKMERQPIRLLESYGVASTAFNRFEDTQLLVGGTWRRNLYWRLQASNGNPLFMRDVNALAGDNGTPDRVPGRVMPRLNSGMPILYNAETESLFFETGNVQLGQAIGYRWQSQDETMGFDAIAFHYRRSLADRQELTGTFYGADLDLLDGALGISLPVRDRVKKEYGTRIYAEWRGLTAIAQFTKQRVAGLNREGYEGEVGYRFPFAFGPRLGGDTLFQSIQPAVRWSRLDNRFRGPGTFVAPSVWWDWTKIDAGVRVGFARNVDVTIEHTESDIDAPIELSQKETLVTLRVRL